MRKKDLVMALMVVIIWGVNFTVIRLGLNGVPSMLLAALRYTFVLPALFFVKRPKIDMKYAIAYGLAVGVGQFSCLFYAMQIGMPAGLSSITLQSAAFMTPLLAFLFLHESIKPKQIIGLFIAAIGLAFIASNAGSITAVPLPALLLTLLAAFFWALSNIVLKFASNKAEALGEKMDMLGVVVWTSLVPPIPLYIISFILDGPDVMLKTVTSLSAISIFSIFYLAFGATIFGYGTWSVLLGKYPASKIAPLSLMVPVTGLLSSQIILKEQLSTSQWTGGFIILLGLIFSTLDIKSLIKFNKV